MSVPMSEADTKRLSWSLLFALRTLHEATLQSLLGARNYAVLQLLRERNNLLLEWYLALASFSYAVWFSHTLFLSYQWRVLLSSPSIEYSETDFISPSDPEALLPYLIAPSGAIVPFRAGRPSGGLYLGVVRVVLHCLRL